jgi:hypothetical protein
MAITTSTVAKTSATALWVMTLGSGEEQHEDGQF